MEVSLENQEDGVGSVCLRVRYGSLSIGFSLKLFVGMSYIATPSDIDSHSDIRSSYLVYLSDDGGSELTFYALLEASHFAKFWVPFCKKFKVQPRSPMACVSNPPAAALNSQEWSNIKILYEEMEERIETATKLGRIPEEMQAKHKGFSEWASVASQHNHPTIL